MNVQLRYHALQRAVARTRMSEQEIQAQLAQGLFVKLGYERNTERAHLMFWSELDQTCFVAVFDERTREVITVLPLTYENRFHMSLESVDLARSLWEQRPKPAQKPPLPETAWHLAAQILDPTGGFKMKNLGRFRPSTARPDERAGELKRYLGEQLNQRGLSWGRVTYIRARTRTGDVHVLYRNRWVELSVAHGTPHQTPDAEPEGVFVWPEGLKACG